MQLMKEEPWNNVYKNKKVNFFLFIAFCTSPGRSSSNDIAVGLYDVRG